MPLRWTWLVLLAVACATTKPPGAILEPESRAVAEGDSSEPRRYVSARAYQHYLDALLARNSDDFATAASELREALLYDPQSPHLHSVLAEVLLKQGRLADAEEELQIALALDPAHAPARLVSARIAAARGRLAEAREHFELGHRGAAGRRGGVPRADSPASWRRAKGRKRRRSRSGSRRGFPMRKSAAGWRRPGDCGSAAGPERGGVGRDRALLGSSTARTTRRAAPSSRPAARRPPIQKR